MRWCSLVLLFFLSAAASATDYFAAGTAGQGFNPAGNDGNSGLTAALPKTASWCLSNLVAADSCEYAAGNYENFILKPTVSGTAGNVILYDCVGKHTCSVDRIQFLNISYIEVRRFKSDTDFFDVTKSATNPRIFFDTADHITMTSVFVRGERDRCSDPNPVPDCRAPDPENRYNDLLWFKRDNHHIEIRSDDTFGETQLIDANHTQFELSDNGNVDACAFDERYFWIHGTPNTPLTMSMTYHHGFSNKGNCDVLVEHVDMLQHGSGRGDLSQPTNSGGFDDQSGGTFHGSDHNRYVIRFSTMSLGGSATEDSGNKAFMETGLFGSAGHTNVTENVCFAHISGWRAWSAAIITGRLNEITNVDDIVHINIAMDELGYGEEFFGAVIADNDSMGFFYERVGNSIGDVYVDGVVFNNVAVIGADRFLWDDIGTEVTILSTDCPTTTEGVECGANITWDTGQLFTDPSNRDFSINDASLTGTASPIALTTDASTGSTIGVTDARSHCFVDDMDGMRPSGDVLDVGGEECTVTAVGTASITCNETLTWGIGESIFYKLDGTIHDDIGAIPDGGSGPGEPDPGPGREMKAHL